MKPVEIGRIRVENVVEWYGPTRPTWVLPDAAPETVERHRDWLAPHFMDARGRFLMSIHSFILRTPGLTVLVDTCVGNDKPRQNPGWHMLQTDFLDRLAAAGCPPESVDLVLCTHLHVDHVGWNTRLVGGRWVPTFPRARYVVAGEEWEYWRYEKDACIADSVVPVVEHGQVDLVESDHALGRWLRFEPSPGHTPGHVSVRLETSAGRAVFSGDLMHRVVQVAEPRWSSRFCADPVRAAATRRDFVERLADSGVLVLAAHFPCPGYIVREDGGTRFTAAV